MHIAILVLLFIQFKFQYPSKKMKCFTCKYWDDNMHGIKEHLIDENPTVIHRSGFSGSVCWSIKVSSVPL